MTQSICSFPGCGRPRKARGLCKTHDLQLKRGEELAPIGRKGPKPRPQVELFWEKVDQNGPISKSRPDLGPCWLWTAATDREGYGSFGSAKRWRARAHRFAYELLVGPIPKFSDEHPGKPLVLDHQCHNEAFANGECAGGPTCPHRRCVNPEHLEPATAKQNITRGAGPEMNRQRARERTHCKNGHEYTPETTRIHASGARECLDCNKVKGCVFPGCDRPHSAVGYCDSHYAQLKRSGVLTPIAERHGPICTYPGCGRPHDAKGYCTGHLWQLKHKGVLAPIAERRTGCAFPDCDRKHAALGYCQGHWQQHRHGRPLSPLPRKQGKR